MIEIVNIGMNHETAPVALRECMATDPENAVKALSIMREDPLIKEGMYLSTCNRVEALFTTEDPNGSRKTILDMMSRMGGVSSDRFFANLYIYKGMESVRHIFKVASSLDSLVVGEPQILGQIKDAYRQATLEKTSGVIINRVMHKAFHVAKRVRTETGISDAAVSISYAAVELAKKIFHDLSDKTVLLIGAGEMAELAARHLLNQNVAGITVANRTFERAVELADAFKGKPVYFNEIDGQLETVDIIVTSTASPDFVIQHDRVKQVLRKRRNRPLFFIDIAVPRDVEPRVNSLGNVYVYDIDDLKGVIEINRAQREREALKAERIVEEEVFKFEKWLKTLAVVPTIRTLQDKVEGIRRAELKKSLGSMGGLSPEQVEAIETLTHSISEKIINDPILALKRKTERSTRDLYLDIARQLFNLDKEDIE